MDIHTPIINTWKTISGVWNGLSIDTKVQVIATFLIGVGTCAISWVIYKRQAKQGRKQRKATQDSAYALVGVQELAVQAGLSSAIDGRLEPYVEKQQIKELYSPHGIPSSRRILFYGPTGIGKTREAVELVQKLDKIRPRNVYLTSRMVDIPDLGPKSRIRNIVLFIDHIAANSTSESLAGDDEEQASTLSERLREVMDFFERQSGEPIDVVITALPNEYKAILKENPGFNAWFECIELPAASKSEKAAYLDGLMRMCRLERPDDSVLKELVDASTDSLGDLYQFVGDLEKEGKGSISPLDIEQFRQGNRVKWQREIYPTFTVNEQTVFQSITKMVQFSFPLHLATVVELCLFIGGKSGFLSAWRYRKSVSNLAKHKWIVIRNGKVHCHHSRLFLKNSSDPSLADDLQWLNSIIPKLVRRRSCRRQLYTLLRALMLALRQYGNVNEAIEVADCILKTRDKHFSADPARSRSSTLFLKGRILYGCGRKRWKECELCYKKAIELYDQNQYARHALASLFQQRGMASEALDLLDQIILANPNDVLAYISKLHIYTELVEDIPRALQTYKLTYKRIKANEPPPYIDLSFDFASVRLAVKIGDMLRDKGDQKRADKRFESTIRKFEALLDKIGKDKPQLESMVRNAYGCFLYDIIGKTDTAIDQLERAHKANPVHTHTLHKLASIYMEASEILTMDRKSCLDKADSCLKQVLEIQPNHYPTTLLLAKLSSHRIPWDNIDKEQFWAKALKVYAQYQAALEPESADCPTRHNSITHHASGCFIWHIEAVAYKRGFEDKPLDLPPAAVEFDKCLSIADHFGAHPPSNLVDHLILIYFTYGNYLLVKASTYQKGCSLLHKAVKLNNASGGGFSFSSKNSFAQAFVGKSLLSIGEINRAKMLLEDAVKTLPSNSRAWWWLGRVYEQQGRYKDAYNCFVKNAELQQSPRFYGQIRGIVRSWISDKLVDYDHNYASLSNICSRRAYELDPDGEQHPKNLSDYAYDLYQDAASKGNASGLKLAKELFLASAMRCLEKGETTSANFPYWYAGKCQENLAGKVDAEALDLYLESASLQGNEKGYSNLMYKVLQYCTPIWDSQSSVSDEIVSKIVATAEKHPELPAANEMVGITLQRSGENQKALPYLRDARKSNVDARKSLLFCYCALGKATEARGIYQEICYKLRSEESKLLRECASKTGIHLD